MEKRIDIKVYYEDTDCLGIVYHANYLKYLERGRTEYINSTGKPINEWNKGGYNFAVYQMQIKFRQAARLGDICEVVTKYKGGSAYRKELEQRLEIDGEVLIDSTVELVCLDANLELREFPEGIFR